MRRPGTGTLLIAAAVVGASCSEPSSVARHAASATIAPVLTDLLVAAVSGIAAGNDGPDQNTLNPYSVAPWVIGVAASCSATDTLAQRVHCQPGGMLADFSSRGVPGDPLYHPTVTAPGVHVISARASTGTVLNTSDAPHDFDLTSSCGLRQEFIAYYTCASGTSMATPHVTGVVALMQERAGGQLTPDQVRSILVQTADPMAGYAVFEVGAGLVNALKAVGRAH